jgi:hypothetical protein
MGPGLSLGFNLAVWKDFPRFESCQGDLWGGDRKVDTTNLSNTQLMFLSKPIKRPTLIQALVPNACNSNNMGD